MSDYSQITFFTPKDSLSTGNPNKIIYGSDVDAEFSAISTAIATKADVDGDAIGAGTPATEINVDNLKLDGNKITSTNTNGNITLEPNGTGSVAITNLTASGDVTFDGGTFFVDASENNVGIGTTSPQSVTNYRVLEVGAANLGSMIVLDGTVTDQFHRIFNNGQLLVIEADPNNITPSAITFKTDGQERGRFEVGGAFLIGTVTAGASKLVVEDDSIQLNTAKTPASASATGTTGQIAWDTNYVYVCVATNTWKRAALATW